MVIKKNYVDFGAGWIDLYDYCMMGYASMPYIPTTIDNDDNDDNDDDYDEFRHKVLIY